MPDGKAGSINRLRSSVGIVEVKGVDLVAIEIFFRKNAVFVVVGSEEDDRHHQGAGKVPGVVLGEAEIV
jgi:hypothetical protein